MNLFGYKIDLIYPFYGEFAAKWVKIDVYRDYYELSKEQLIQFLLLQD
jgi:hypothetical protein